MTPFSKTAKEILENVKAEAQSWDAMNGYSLRPNRKTDYIAEALSALEEAHKAEIESRLPKEKNGKIELGTYEESAIDQIENDTAVVITWRQGYNQALADVKKQLEIG